MILCDIVKTVMTASYLSLNNLKFFNKVRTKPGNKHLNLTKKNSSANKTWN